MRAIDGDKLRQYAREADKMGAMLVVGLGYILEAPTVETVPIGHWLHLGDDEWCCSQCRNVVHTEGSWDAQWMKFCPACGAKMESINL